MKKIIVLLLTLSLLLCMSATAFAAEGDDGGNEPITTVGDAPETSVESSTETEADPTEDTNEAETSAPVEQSDDLETSDPAAESGTLETTEPTDESTGPEGDVSTGSSEVSQETVDNEADVDTQPASNGEPITNGEILGDSPMPANSTFNVTIEWSGMCFTYHEKPLGEWNPNLNPPRYDDSEATPYWTSSDSVHPSCGTITVKLTEEIEPTDLVTVDFKFNRTFGKYVAMYFSDNPENVKQGSTLGKTLEFVYGSLKEQSVYVIPGSGTLTSADFSGVDAEPVSLGNITVTITVSGLYDPENPEEPGME